MEALAESRTAALEVVSELLSQHVLQNYDKFVAGIDEVGLVEQDLVSAYATVKSARTNLRASSTEISTNIKVTRQSRRKQKLLDLLDPLLKLQQAKDLHISLKEALQEGDYAHAFWLCVQCGAAMGALGMLRCASHLAANVDALYDEAAERLETALLAACADFQPDAYCKVLEGYIFLGNVNELNTRLTNAITSAVSTTVVRSVILTRPGLEERARASVPVQDMVRGLPADLFRTCLARALMVVFDMMASHHKMASFHDSVLDLNMSGLAKLREAKRACHARIRQEHSPTIKVHGEELIPGPMPLANGGSGSSSESGLIKAVSIRDVAPVNTAGDTHASTAAGSPRGSGSPRRRAKPAWAEVLSSGPHLHRTSSKGSQALQLARSMGQAGVRRLGSDEEGQPQSVECFIEALACKDAFEELQGLEWREAEEVEWGDVLRVSQRGMWASRGFLWEEAARNVACLLACPAAWDGDHFLQVSEWVQRILEAGDAFAGPDGASGLRSLLALQTGNFFAAYHAENLEALHSMLDKELWRRLPSAGAEAGNLWQGIAAQGKMQKGNVGSFDKILSAGNPWRRKHLRRRLAKQGTAVVSFQLGFGGASALEEDRAARKLEVDEHGIARRVSDDIWRTSAATTHAVLSDDEEEEELLSGDSLWEDEQASRAGEGSSAGGQQSGTMPVTNSALKLAKWMQVYGELLRSLRPAPFVYRGLCELFEMYLVHVFVAFSDLSLADMLEADSPEAQQAEAVSPRLRATLVRIVAGSLAKFRASLIAKQQKWLQQLAKEAGGEGSQFLSYLKMKDRTSVAAMPAAPASAAAALAQLSGSPAAAPKLSHSGNQWGLQERVVAASSLEAFAQQLRQGKSAIQALLPAAEHPALDAFFSRTVDAAGDVSECLLRCGARLNFNLASTAGAISGQFWDLSQPPMQASRWVEDVCRQANYFGEKLRQVAGLTEQHRSQLWCFAGTLLAEVILEGVSRIRGRCSAIGRNAISADVQEAMHALKSLAPVSATVAASLEKSSRLVDVYIKAFFLTGVEELGQWAVTHPEYTREQHLALATAVAQFKGLKKKDQTAFVAQVEASLI
ncbi:probable Syndetin [Coccomyxa sp. Obi]|nr:probable Syndetin [Coccomyxa sp. Obi]